MTFPVRLYIRTFAEALMLLAIVAALGTVSALSQTCPTHIGPVPLTNSNSAKVSCTTSQGRMICSLWCDYSQTRADGAVQGANIKFQWVRKLDRANAPLLEDSCGPGTKIPYGQRHPNNQAIVRWSGTNTTLEKYAEVAAGLMWWRTAELAVPCKPGPIPADPNAGLPLPAIDPWCQSKGLAWGRFEVISGTVDVFSHALNKWRGPFPAGFPVYRCDWIRTGPDSEAVAYIYTPSGAEDRVNMSSDTILEIPGDPNYTEPEATFVDLVKGTIKWFSEKPTQTRPPSPFNVRTPTIVTARRGTEFVLRHDDILKKDYIFVNSGSVEVSAGGVKKLVTGGQQMFAERSKLSAVYSMPANIWTAASGLRRNTAWEQLFSGAAVVSTEVDTGKGKSGSTGSDVGTIGGFTGPIFNIAYLGRNYRTVYERSTHENTPIDLYYFEIIGSDSRPVSQDGAKLWGRFVRQPASDQEAKSGVTYWFVEWIFRGGRWERIETKVGGFMPIREIQK